MQSVLMARNSTTFAAHLPSAALPSSLYGSLAYMTSAIAQRETTVTDMLM
jgi:hypothetical protein